MENTLYHTTNEKRKINFKLEPNLIKTLEQRKIFFLDTSTWIDIADEKSYTAKNLKRKLRRLVNTERVFRPLSLAMIWELRKQKFDSALRVGELMEELSSVTYKWPREIFRNEISNYLVKTLTGVLYLLK